ncbi:HD domain-containing protein, partial [bacterium]
LRLLRAYRFAAQYNFSIDKRTAEAIKKHVKLIVLSSSERIREEISKIFQTTKSFHIIYSMDRIGLLEKIFPEIKNLKKEKTYYFHPEGLWGHCLEVLYCYEFILQNLSSLFDKEKLQLLLNYIDSSNMKIILALSSLLHDAGKPETLKVESGKVQFHGHERLSSKKIKNIMKDLKFSNKTIELTKSIAYYHMSLGNMVPLKNVTDKAFYRFFKKAGEAAFGVMIITLADCLASMRGAHNISYKDTISVQEFESENFKQYRDFVNRVFSWYLSKRKVMAKKRILSGTDIMQKLKLKQGKLIGKILDILDEKVVEGKIKTKAQAFNFIKKWLKEQK